MAPLYRYCGVGVTPVVITGGDESILGVPTSGVTTGAAGISCGETVRVEIVGWRGSLAQSFQFFETVR